jgi:hypothetical protein
MMAPALTRCTFHFEGYMLQFLTENPLCLMALFCLFWPGLVWIGLGYWVGRNGSPVEIRLRRRGDASPPQREDI